MKTSYRKRVQDTWGSIQETYIRILIVVLFITAKSWEINQVFINDIEWINKLIYTIHIIYYRAVKVKTTTICINMGESQKIMLNKKGKFQMNTFSIVIRNFEPNVRNTYMCGNLEKS